MAAEYEFKVIGQFVKTLSQNGGDDTQKVVKRDVYSRLTCRLDDISAVAEAITRTGGINKRQCLIFHKDYKELLVSGNYEKISKIVFPEEEIKHIGYGFSK